MLEKRKRALLEEAQPQLEPGEQVREIMIGQTAVSPFIYLLVGPVLFAFMAKPRIVMGTDRNVYVFEGDMWRGKKMKRVLVKQPLGFAPVRLTKLSITIGPEKVYTLLGQGAPMKAIAAMAQPGGAEPQALAPTAGA